MSISQDRAAALEERLLAYSSAVINLTRQLPQSQEFRIISNQLIRAATSVGANYAEANNVMSRQDFRNKIFIAKKEAAESRYWLKLLKHTTDTAPLIDMAIKEVSELLMILQKIVSTMKNAK